MRLSPRAAEFGIPGNYGNEAAAATPRRTTQRRRHAALTRRSTQPLCSSFRFPPKPTARTIVTTATKERELTTLALMRVQKAQVAWTPVSSSTKMGRCGASSGGAHDGQASHGAGGHACRRSEKTRTDVPTNDGPVQALTDVDLTIGKGEFVSFIGPSGCGKTTFLRVIADLEKPTEGTISVNGMTPQQARESRAYGYVFQAAALFPWRTIDRNVALPLEIMGVSAAEQKARIARVMDLVNLTGFENKYPWQLSGGMQQRASIARALAFDADLLADGRAVRCAGRDRARPSQQAAAWNSGRAPTRRSASSRIRSRKQSTCRPASS